MDKQSPQDVVETRRRFVDAWNKTLISIWRERIYKLKVIDKGNLYRSPEFNAPVYGDDRLMDVTVSQLFLEHGLWQDLGVGRNTAIGNTHKKDNDGFVNMRKRRRWYSTKFYASAMRLKEFFSESLGHEFVAMFAVLDVEKQKLNTNYYKKLLNS